MKITVFGATWCAFCHTEKQWLDSKGVEYEYHDVDIDESAMEYLQDTTKAQSVPVTIIEKGESGDKSVDIIRGFDRPKLSKSIGI